MAYGFYTFSRSFLLSVSYTHLTLPTIRDSCDTVQNISAAFGGILSKMAGGGRHTTGAYLSRMGNALGGANGFYLYYEDNIPDDVKNILLIQQLS